MPELSKQIYIVLANSTSGKSAKDIAQIIEATRGNVNRCLYANPDMFFKSADYVPLWSIKSTHQIDPVMSKLQNREGAKSFTKSDFLSIADWTYGESYNSHQGLIYKTADGNYIKCDSKSEMAMLSYLEENNLVIALGGQNLRITYDSAFRKDLSYYPDIIALTVDNHIAIIEIKPATAMDYHKNVEKYQALEKYCLEKGYLYGMVDPQQEYISYEEVRDMDVSTVLFSMFEEWDNQVDDCDCPFKFFTKDGVDYWYEEYGSIYTRKDFDLQVHSLVLYFGWYNYYKNGFMVYNRPVKLNQDHDVIEIL